MRAATRLSNENPAGSGIERFDWLLNQADAPVDEMAVGAENLLFSCLAERQKQQPRLVDMLLRRIYDRDRELFPLGLPAQAVRHDTPAGTGAENDNLLHRASHEPCRVWQP